MHTFENYRLGIEDDEVLIDTAGGNHLAATMMAQQCKRNVGIISRELDPVIYDTDTFVEALKQALLENRRAKVRIIVFNTQVISRRGHKLLELAGNLPSYIEFRKAGKEYDDFNESLFVADVTGYIYRNNAERFEGKVNFNDKRRSKILMNVFEEMWNRSTPDPNLRKLSI